MNIQGNIDVKIGGTITFQFVPSQPASSIMAYFYVKYGGLTMKVKGDNVAYQLPDDQMIHVAVTYVDMQGNPAVVDGPVTWTSSDTTILIVDPWTPSGSDTVPVGVPENGLATVSPVGPLGQAQVSVTADVDMGSGVTPLVTLMDIAVIAGTAVAGTIAPVGDPIPLPLPPAP